MVYFSFSAGLGEKSRVLFIGQLHVRGRRPWGRSALRGQRRGCAPGAGRGLVSTRCAPEGRLDQTHSLPARGSRAPLVPSRSCPTSPPRPRPPEPAKGGWVSTGASSHKHQVDPRTREQKLFLAVPLSGIRGGSGSHRASTLASQSGLGPHTGLLLA